MISVPLVALTTFLALATAAPADKARYVRHETRGEHSQWTKREAVPSDVVLPMRIGLTQGNMHLGHDLLMEVSDPRSSKYGKFYTAEEIHDMFAPSREAVEAVTAWLEEAGIPSERVSQSVNKQWLQFDASTHEAEALLKTKMHIYEHDMDGKTSIGCDEYHVMEGLSEHIDYITPGLKMIELRTTQPKSNLKKRDNESSKFGPIITDIPQNLDLKVAANTLQYCDSIVTPNCIMAMYNISAGDKAATGNELGIFEETAQYLDSSDMNHFFKNFYPKIPHGTFPILKEIDGAKNNNTPQAGGTEPLLDFQISYPLIWPQNSVLFLTDDSERPGTPGLFNTFLDAIDGSYCTFTAFGETGDNSTVDPTYPNAGWKHPEQCGVYKPTNVISISWELAEFNEGTSENYQKRQCLEYMKLGMQGVSVIFSSGDSGVASSWGCGLNKEKKPKIFNPLFPSNCPYVTSVGATTLTGSATADEERAVDQFGSGGGFSNYWPRPSYQDSAVTAYFNSASAPTYPYYNGSSFGDGIYNRSGRGIPDVSAIGQAVLNIGDGHPYLVGGTSASAPVFASLINRINEERLAVGKSTVGFLNPTLYQNPGAFHDITVGNNPGCGTKGFEAAVGWDPLTGLGTPNYPALLKVFMGQK